MIEAINGLTKLVFFYKFAKTPDNDFTYFVVL